MPDRRRLPCLFLLLLTTVASVAMPAVAQAQAARPGLGAAPTKAATPATAGFVFGKVVSIEPADGTIVIDHEDIPNLGMSPMAMEFHVKDRAALTRLKPGDAVRFRALREAGRYVAADLAPR